MKANSTLTGNLNIHLSLVVIRTPCIAFIAKYVRVAGTMVHLMSSIIESWVPSLNLKKQQLARTRGVYSQTKKQ